MPASIRRDMAGRDYAEVELLALLEDVGPDVVGVEHGVVQVDLEAEFSGEAGARDGNGMAVDRVVDQAVVGHLADVRADHLLQERGLLYDGGGFVPLPSLNSASHHQHRRFENM